MKKSNLSIALVAGAFSVLALSTKLTAADSPTPAGCCAAPKTMASCCGAAAEPMADKAKSDLLNTCPVSGEKLGEMGKPYTFTYEKQEVKLCCKGCKKDFDKDPAKYMKLIRAADKK